MLPRGEGGQGYCRESGEASAGCVSPSRGLQTSAAAAAPRTIMPAAEDAPSAGRGGLAAQSAPAPPPGVTEVQLKMWQVVMQRRTRQIKSLSHEKLLALLLAFARDLAPSGCSANSSTGLEDNDDYSAFLLTDSPSPDMAIGKVVLIHILALFYMSVDGRLPLSVRRQSLDASKRAFNRLDFWVAERNAREKARGSSSNEDMDDMESDLLRAVAHDAKQHGQNLAPDCEFDSAGNDVDLTDENGSDKVCGDALNSSITVEHGNVFCGGTPGNPAAEKTAAQTSPARSALAELQQQPREARPRKRHRRVASGVTFDVDAPPGQLGMSLVLEPSVEGARVGNIKSDCPLRGKVCLGDILVKIDGKRVASLECLMVGNERVRRFQFVRKSQATREFSNDEGEERAAWRQSLHMISKDSYFTDLLHGMTGDSYVEYARALCGGDAKTLAGMIVETARFHMDRCNNQMNLSEFFQNYHDVLSPAFAELIKLSNLRNSYNNNSAKATIPTHPPLPLPPDVMPVNVHQHGAIGQNCGRGEDQCVALKNGVVPVFALVSVSLGGGSGTVNQQYCSTCNDCFQEIGFDPTKTFTGKEAFDTYMTAYATKHNFKLTKETGAKVNVGAVKLPKYVSVHCSKKSAHRRGSTCDCPFKVSAVLREKGGGTYEYKLNKIELAHEFPVPATVCNNEVPRQLTVEPAAVLTEWSEDEQTAIPPPLPLPSLSGRNFIPGESQEANPFAIAEDPLKDESKPAAKETAAASTVGAAPSKASNKRGTYKSFAERIADLEAYKAKHGHVNVSPNEDAGLARFCAQSRHSKRNPSKGNMKLDKERTAALDALGFCWTNNDTDEGIVIAAACADGAAPSKASRKRVAYKTFAERIADLKAYRAKHGHVNVSHDEDASLAQFCAQARHSKKNPSKGAKKLGEERIAALDALGFRWSLRDGHGNGAADDAPSADCSSLAGVCDV